MKAFPVVVGLGVVISGCSQPSTAPAVSSPPALTPSVSATWPWPGASETHPFTGVTRWTETAPDDGTQLELLRFDFSTNPRHRFGIYDQDQDDATPFDNKTDFFGHGVGWVTNHLNAGRRVLFACNGLFFAFDHSPGSPKNGWARHIGPIVIDGKTHYNVGQHRWTFGVKYDANGLPTFDAVFMPDVKSLSSRFDFAADGAQLLVKDGKALRVVTHDKKHVDSDLEVGSIPIVDEIKTSRVSLGWSKDSRQLHILVVDEPDTETESINALRRGVSQKGGWSTADLQVFWLKLGVWGAINSDGGMETQRTLMNSDGSYDLLAPLSSGHRGHEKLAGDGPGGGTLLSFYVLASPTDLRFERKP